MDTINQKEKEYTQKRFHKLSAKDCFFFNRQAEGEAYKEGMKEAFRMIEHEIDVCCVNSLPFPILHIRDFIDKMLERK